MNRARKVASIERQLMKLKPGVRRKLLRLAYYLGRTR